MKTLAVRQPWCTLIAEGSKTIEVRSWRTQYRGPLLIAASGKPYSLDYGNDHIVQLPTQRLICVVDLVDCRPWLRTETAASGLDEWDTGYWGWHLSNPRHVRPLTHSGKLSLYETPDDQITILPDGWHYLDYPDSGCRRCRHPPGIDWLDGGRFAFAMIYTS